MKTRLHGDGSFVEIDGQGLQISASGLAGEVVITSGSESGTRSLNSPSDGIKDILEDADLEIVQEFELDLEEDTSATRSLDGGDDTKAVRIKLRKGADKGYAMLMHDDEEGFMWVFPEEEASRSLDGADEVTFNIPIKADQQDEDGDSRGLGKFAFRTIVKIIAWATAGLVGKTGSKIIKNWEKKKRPYEFVAMKPGQVQKNSKMDSVDWNLFKKGKGLLFIHGTFSSIQGSYGDLLASEEFKKLYDRYEGRIIGFNHPSLKDTPEENMQMFFKMVKEEVPEDVPLDLDIVTSSRGGLVGRNIIRVLDQSDRSAVNLKVDRAVLVAPPNRGSELANPNRWKELINRYTNLTNFIPGNPGLAVLDGVVALIKVIGVPIIDRLPGLEAMVPGNDSLVRLNTHATSQTTFYTLGASFQPGGKGFGKFVRKVGEAAIDAFFEEESDTVVPTQGTYNSGFASNTDSLNRASMQNIFFVEDTHREVYIKEKGMHHLNYFKHQQVNQKLLEWLDIG